MGATIKGLILGLLGSKKFIVLVSGLIVTGIAKYKINLDPLMVQGMLAALVAYLLGQGIADSGKGAAEVAALAQTPPQPTVDAIKAV